jgi:HAD superfamily hydrolase (TIGR01509 family)
MKLQAIVFDYDGLIVNTERPGFVSWSEIYARFGQKLTLTDWYYATGYVDGFDPGLHLEKLLGRKLNWDELGPERDRRNWELTLTEPVLPGIAELLASARAHSLRIGVASNSGGSWVPDGLQRLGLASYVDVVITRDMVVDPKPAPDIYLKTVQTLGVNSENAVALEDSEPGCRAAKAAGIKVVAIPNEFSAQQDLSIADLIVPDATELSVEQLNALMKG